MGSLLSGNNVGYFTNTSHKSTKNGTKNMTAQVSDIVSYGGSQLHLAAYSNGEPFDPVKYGYKPVMASTACWRGYLCEYKIENQQLYLDKLHINHQESDTPFSQAKPPPKLNGSDASIAKRSHIGRWLFENVGLAIDYTGGLVVAQGFIRDLYVHMGFHPAWKYEEVYELIFEKGKFKEGIDLSSKMTDIRQKIESEDKKKSENASREEIEKWIEDCFRRDYKR
jgi:hypothetical protein